MTDLKKTVSRVSTARIFERSKHRPVIIVLEPPARVGFRLQGTRRTYFLDADTLYMAAVREHEREAQKEKKRR
jgi:hypothetical protein